MHNRTILLESNRLENQLINFQIEGALLEVIKNDFMARVIIAEHRKIEKYALQLGVIDKRQLNEGFLADVVLGAGQMLGNWASIVGVPLGSAFGVAGVLWYGNEMLSTAPGSFDFFMNLIFCLFSAAAVPDPTPASGTASTLAKTIIAPFAKLGNAARALGNGVLDAGKALAWVKASGPAAAVATEAAVKAEPAVKAAAPWIERTIAGAGEVMTSISAKVKSLPGGSKFTAMIETVTKYARQAWAFIKGCIESLINVGKSAAGKAGAKVATAAAEALPSLIKRLSPQMAEKIVAQFAGKTFSYNVAAGTRYVLPPNFTAASRAAAIAAGQKVPMIAKKFAAYPAVVAIDSLKIGKGSIWVAQKGGNGFAVGAAELPGFITQVAKSFGNEAAAAILVKAQAAFPQTVIMSAMRATSEANNSITMPAGA